MASATSSPPAEYKYTPIKTAESIRLVHLLPAPSLDARLDIAIYQTPLSSSPKFGALSYSWATEDGDSSLSSELECQGSVIRISKNCEAGLRRLRQIGKEVLIWVDALCIDQSNDDEKTQQISLMRQIYGQADWVAIWVGEASAVNDETTSLPLSDLGMSFIHEFAVEIADRSNAGQDVGQGPLYREFVRDRRAFQERGIRVFTPRVIGLWDILHRRWWKRVWVLQELALADKAILICGDKTEDFHNLTVVINALARDGQDVEEFEFQANFITNTFHQFYMRKFVKSRHLMGDGTSTAPPGKKALDILQATRNTRATDPRDKVYGVLGFFGDPESDPENILPGPDYRKTAAELYAEVARLIITHTGQLDVMSSCYGNFRSTVPDLPSWAASWNDTPLQYFDHKSFNAANGSSVIQADSGAYNLLKLKGRRIDSVKDIDNGPDTLEYTNPACVELWRKWADLAFSLESYPTRDSVADVFMNTLCWGSNLKHERLAPMEYQETFDAWYKILRSVDAADTAAKKLFESQEAFTFSHRASFMTWARTIAMTAKSYLALLPITSKEGDEIVIFSGGKVPFVVHPEADTWKLVGPCYIHGVMDGEVFSKDTTPDELEWYTLR